MMRDIRRFGMMMALVVAVALSALGQQMTDPTESVCAMSQRLTAYKATIRMTQHQARSDSVIEFTFDFVPPDRMRIAYTAPATVEGQLMILNADRFYTYIPSLNRSVWQNVGEGSSNQGEEMGFLYDFVTQSAAGALEQANVQVAENRETFVLEGTDETLDVDVLTLVTDEERQVVLLNVLDAAPVAIEIFRDGDLVMEIRVLDYEVSGAFDEAWFAIPEK